MSDWGLATAIADRQHFVVTTWQLGMCGIGRTAIAERVKQRVLTRRHRGVLEFQGDPLPIRDLAAAVLAYSRPVGAAARVEQLQQDGLTRDAAIARAAVDSGQLLCGPSALWLHGVRDWDDEIWLRLPEGKGNATRGAIHFRHGAPTGEVAWVQGLPAVDIEQAFLDLPGCWRHLSPRQLHYRLTTTLSAADARRKTTIEQVETRMAEAGRILGSRALAEAILDLRGELTHSGREKRARRIVEEVLAPHGLILHPRPYAVTYEGRCVGEADLGVVAIKLDIEVDGPHHDRPAQQAKDRERDKYMRRAGWEVERLSTELLDVSPKVFAARVDDAVRHRLASVR